MQGAVEGLEAIVGDHFLEPLAEVIQVGQSGNGHPYPNQFKHAAPLDEVEHGLRADTGGVQGTYDGSGTGAGYPIRYDVVLEKGL